MELIIPAVTATRYRPGAAKEYPPFCNRVCSLLPEGADIPLQFLSVRITPDSVTAPETNECGKIFYILDGEGVIDVGGEEFALCSGETIWLPKGSVHVIKTGGGELSLLVIK